MSRSGSLVHPADHDVLVAVKKEFDWAPEIDASHIVVAIDGAVISLTGEVPSLEQVRYATRAALGVKGVTSVANDITVRLPWKSAQTDREIAQAVFDSIFWTSVVPRDRIKIAVTDQVVALSGELDWNFQRQAAEKIARRIVGVHRVINGILLVERATAADTAAHIRSALVRSATVDSNAVQIAIDGNVVTLTGNVHSFAEKFDAGRGAWSSPHVTNVYNLLVVKGI
jgi:osmotically-inducible protein OsmY